MPPEVQAFLAEVSGLQIIIWGGVAIAAAVGIYKAWPVIRRFVRTIDALGDLPDFMERIRHQVENDHDTNLRDEISQVLDSLNDMTGQIARLADWQKKHEGKSDAALARIHALEAKEK